MSKRQKVVQIEGPQDGTGSSSLPVIYFPTGAPPPSSASRQGKGSGESDGGLQFTMYSRPPGKGVVAQHVLVGSRDRMDYVGSTANIEYSAVQPCSYAVGVYDKASGKLQLLPLPGGKVLRMEARLHGLNYDASAHTVQEPNTYEERLALNKRLVDSFGSTRRRRQLTATAEGVVRAEKIGSSAALTQVMESGVKAAEQQGLTKDQVIARSTKVRNLPPHHMEARTAAAAYVFEEMLTSAALNSLDVGRLFAAAENAVAYAKLSSANIVPQYVLGRLHLLRDPDKAKARQKAHMLAFLAALLTSLDARPELRLDPARSGLGAAAHRMHMKPELLQEMLELFYNRRREGNMEVYERPGQKKELQLAYVLVLAQLVEGGGLASVQFEALRTELKITPAELVTRFREVGSTCSATSVKMEDAEGERAKQRAYNVMLLKGNKTLAESLPGIKHASGAKR